MTTFDQHSFPDTTTASSVPRCSETQSETSQSETSQTGPWHIELGCVSLFKHLAGHKDTHPNSINVMPKFVVEEQMILFDKDSVICEGVAERWGGVSGKYRGNWIFREKDKVQEREVKVKGNQKAVYFFWHWKKTSFENPLCLSNFDLNDDVSSVASSVNTLSGLNPYYEEFAETEETLTDPCLNFRVTFKMLSREDVELSLLCLLQQADDMSTLLSDCINI